MRGLGLFAGQFWPVWWPVRIAGYAIDTVLLTAALILTTILQQYPFVHSWLTAKVMLLVVYVFLGYIAYWSARPRAVRLACWVTALGVFGFIVAVARSHHPLAFLGSIAN